MQEHRGDIIVVEDDHSVNHAIRRLLQAAGFRARTFESAEALLVQTSEDRRADCFVFDMHLPGMSGVQLCDKLRELGESTPVIMITAHDDARHREAATQSGVSAYICKPFSGRALVTAVADTIEPDDLSRD